MVHRRRRLDDNRRYYKETDTVCKRGVPECVSGAYVSLCGDSSRRKEILIVVGVGHDM